MKYKILTFLKEKKGYISGQRIADKLHITRNAVHKHINSLRTLGYSIKSKRAFGYKLVDDLNIIDYPSVENRFKGQTLGRQIVHYKSIGSTNDGAYKLAEGGCREGTVVISDLQTKGRGRMGRTWESSQTNNLYFSVVLRPKLLPSSAPKITVLSALAVSEAIEETTSLRPKIKWPNDILLNGKKVCGILTEMKSESDMIDFVIIGIGVNVNSMRRDYPKNLQGSVTTLKHETGKTIPRQVVFERIISNLEKWCIIQINSEFGKVKDKWKHYSFLSGKTVTVKNINEKLVGTVLGIDESGFLVLKAGGTTKKIFSGTIEKVR